MIKRLGRGYAPYAIPVFFDCAVLSVGAQQKSSICLLSGGYAHISQYIGDLSDFHTCTDYEKIIERFVKLYKASPQFIAFDLSPVYYSTQYAQKSSCIKIPIQHHHAHMVAAMAEHGLRHKCIGIIYDGTGYGTDGTVWGGEFLVGSRREFVRAAHLKYVTLQGGELSVTQPLRCAVSYLQSIGIDTGIITDRQRVDAVHEALKMGINCYASSSMGRLFDCVAALVLKIYDITYDAQAAIELEAAADFSAPGEYNFSIENEEEIFILDYEEILSGIIKDIIHGVHASAISAKFHRTVCSATVECAEKIRSKTQINDVVLGGGVFENEFLLIEITRKLTQKNFSVYYNKKIPINDNGLSFGQAMAAQAIIKEGSYVFSDSGKNRIGREYICKSANNGRDPKD